VDGRLVSPWQPYEQRSGRDIWFNLQRRRYGGDLQGIIDRLDYLTDLGVEALYLNPVFDAPFGPQVRRRDLPPHRPPTLAPTPTATGASSPAEIPGDPTTWLWTAADRLALRLIDEAHRRGLRIIFDGVWNHMGITQLGLPATWLRASASRPIATGST
jgi:cyclomaltodextrinase